MFLKFTTYRPCLLAAASFAALSCSSTAWADAPPACVDVPLAPESTECGSNSMVDVGSNVSSAIGTDTFATGRSATAVGSHAVASASPNQFTTLDPAPSDDNGATSLGSYAYAIGSSSVAIGDQAVVGVLVPAPNVTYNAVFGGTAIGSNSTVSADNGTALGIFSSASGLSSTTLGAFSTATDVRSTAIGASANATGIGGFAGGSLSAADGDLGVAIGSWIDLDEDMTVEGNEITRASGLESSALGAAAQALGVGSLATGARSVADGINATAIGYGATATADGAIAIGAGSVADTTNTVSVGSVGNERRITNVASGTLAAGSTDAVSGGQLFVTNQNVTANTTAITTLQTSVGSQVTQISALQAADTLLDTRVDTLELIASGLDDRIDRIDDRASAGTAAAVALSGAMFLPGKTFNLTGNVGTYRGAHAAALQFGALVSDNVAINAGVAHGFNRGGKTALRAGFTIGW